MCGDARKPDFGISDKVRFQPACSATKTTQKIEFFLVVILDMILSNKGIKKALIRLCECAGWSAPLLFANPRKQVFLASRPIVISLGLRSALLEGLV